MIELAAAGLMTSAEVAKQLGISLPKLRMLVSVGLVNPRPKRVGRMSLWTRADIDRARTAIADMNKKRSDAKASMDR